MELTCHCENIHFTVERPKQITSCNCSICRRYGALWAYYDPGAVNTTIGKYGVETYIWGDKEVEFVRCAHCGCITHYQTFEGDPEPRVAVNFRMADEEWVSGIDVRYFNGKEA